MAAVDNNSRTSNQDTGGTSVSSKYWQHFYLRGSVRLVLIIRLLAVIEISIHLVDL